MKVLVVGGAGRVGTFVTPYLQDAGHEVRVLDMRAPSPDGVEFVEGSMLDVDALRTGLDGVDTFVNMVMKSPGSSTNPMLQRITDNYELNTLGLHLLLFTAHELGVTRGVHTSTMSVHDRSRGYYAGEESLPLDNPDIYGFTKGLGERICQYFARWFDMNLIGLRITGPRERENYLKERQDPPAKKAGHPTDEEDLARAYLAALDMVGVGHGRFEALFIAGDEDEHEHNLTKARRVLRWEPTSHRHLPARNGS